jgi:hypothetical protein
MTDKNRSRSDWTVWVMILFVLIAVYGGAYAVMVTPLHAVTCPVTSDPLRPFTMDVYAENELTNGVLKRAFGPANTTALD